MNQTTFTIKNWTVKTDNSGEGLWIETPKGWKQIISYMDFTIADTDNYNTAYRRIVRALQKLGYV